MLGLLFSVSFFLGLDFFLLVFFLGFLTPVVTGAVILAIFRGMSTRGGWLGLASSDSDSNSDSESDKLELSYEL